MDDTCQKLKIGILGGTFNPIHSGHLILAQNALNYLKLDKVIFIPTGVSYFKDSNEVVSAKHRLNMAQLAINDNPKFELSTIETEREGNSYTYETLEILKKENCDTRYFYIIGADTLFKMDTWKYPERIFDKCTICCQKRDEYTDDELNDRVRYLNKKFNAEIILMDIPEVRISSTYIRESLCKGYEMRYYLPVDVIDYIKNNNLYL